MREYPNWAACLVNDRCLSQRALPKQRSHLIEPEIRRQTKAAGREQEGQRGRFRRVFRWLPDDQPQLGRGFWYSRELAFDSSGRFASAKRNPYTNGVAQAG